MLTASSNGWTEVVMSRASLVPTVVLVHGAFADGSSWNDVIARLNERDVPAIAVVNPLRGISIDSAYVAGVFQQTTGPVLAVGHSYGGAVITNAAAHADNVRGLVFVAAFAPEEGERLGEVAAGSKDSVLGSVLVPRRYPSADVGEAAVEFTVDRGRLHEVFAADLPPRQTALMAATQRPIAELAVTEPTAAAAWKTVPSWAVIATADKAAGTDIVRSMAKRAGARITEVEGSHVPMLSHPDAVTDVILDAVEATRAGEEQLVR
jgi:pimeloyl-ACP methyl ester carboxylesterase